MPSDMPSNLSSDLSSVSGQQLPTSAPVPHAQLNETHDASLKSWVQSANDEASDFPVQNLPFGVFRLIDSKTHDFSGGVAIGDQILDLTAACKSGLFSGVAASAAQAAALGQMNTFMALGRPAWAALRLAVSQLLREDNTKRDKARACLVPMKKVDMGVPARVGNYTDFFASVHHAMNVGKLFRPDAPLLPNYKYVPIGYHGRASSVRPSGHTVKRPNGQLMPAGAAAPHVGQSQRLDYELEMGVWIGPGNVLGEPIAIADAEDHIFGLCLLNDWSARDVQSWEYQPLGPFLAKSFLTSVSPWIVTLEALAPFRTPLATRPESDPQPLPYLTNDYQAMGGGFDIALEAFIETDRMQTAKTAAHQLSHASLKHLYWTVGQMVTHHSMGGCNLESGDLLGTGTTSGPEADSLGCLLEITEGGKKPIELPSGESRTFLQNGDRLTIKAYCQKEGTRRIGFGECSGTII
jgi:fumarylacetoacetase